MFNDTTRCFMGFNPIFRYAEQNCDWSVAVSLKIVEDKKLLVDLKKNVSVNCLLVLKLKQMSCFLAEKMSFRKKNL